MSCAAVSSARGSQCSGGALAGQAVDQGEALGMHGAPAAGRDLLREVGAAAKNKSNFRNFHLEPNRKSIVTRLYQGLMGNIT